MLNNKLTEIQKIIMNKIEKYNNISLFFHERPDFDTLGSCYALLQYITEVYPNKKAKIIGFDTLPKEYCKDFFPYNPEKIPDSFIKDSLGIVSDTANKIRVHSQKESLCIETIRIDHHPEKEKFCTTEWIQPIFPATVQMISTMLLNSGYSLSSTISKYIYAGLVTDTDRFLHYNTNPDSYDLASKMLETGFNRKEVHDAVYKMDLKELHMNSYVIKKTKIEQGVAYAVIPAKQYKKYGIDVQYSYVNSLANIKGVYIWSTLYFDLRANSWKGSIRSDDIPINHIAEKYNGGGHRFAAGFSLKNINEYKKLIKELKDYLLTLNIDK
ncbi:MAG: DHH family phosphoesterase [Mycoplasmoidaceae bacterium]